MDAQYSLHLSLHPAPDHLHAACSSFHPASLQPTSDAATRIVSFRRFSSLWEAVGAVPRLRRRDNTDAFRHSPVHDASLQPCRASLQNWNVYRSLRVGQKKNSSSTFSHPAVSFALSRGQRLPVSISHSLKRPRKAPFLSGTGHRRGILDDPIGRLAMIFYQ